MMPGTIAVPLILASAVGLDRSDTSLLVSANFLAVGLTTLIHALGIGRVGTRLPIIFGSSFAPLAPMILIGKNYGMAALFGSIITSGLLIPAAGMALLLAFLPKVATALTAIPKPVVGGATLYLFGIVTAAGLSILSSLDFGRNHHFTIIGTSLAVGIGTQFASGAFKALPETLSMLLGDGLFMVAATAVLLNLLYNGLGKRAIDDEVKNAGTRSRHIQNDDA